MFRRKYKDRLFCLWAQLLDRRRVVTQLSSKAGNLNLTNCVGREKKIDFFSPHERYALRFCRVHMSIQHAHRSTLLQNTYSPTEYVCRYAGLLDANVHKTCAPLCSIVAHMKYVHPSAVPLRTDAFYVCRSAVPVRTNASYNMCVALQYSCAQTPLITCVSLCSTLTHKRLL